jgi:hypothetical protein
MSTGLQELLKARVLNRWHLFFLIAVPMSILIILEMMSVDMADPRGVSHMIGYSVRWAVPFIFLVIGISSLQILFPGAVPAWLLKNRKYIGLCFAVAMAWQGFFIFVMSNFNREYYYDEIFYLRDELEGSTGYIFLTAMVLTSFQFGRKYLSPKQWKVLHKCALYYLFAYPFSVYWWNTSYYPNPQPIDFVFYWFGFTAFAMRIAAWGVKRQRAAGADSLGSGTPLVYKLPGIIIILAGLLVAATGRQWQESVSAFLTTPAWSANLELWLPYWPFEPYLSLFMLGIGTMLVTRTGSRASDIQVSEPVTAG